ncbi:MAG: glyoxalase [Lachnospiraceae bacterium]|nr:glyoxalase [Lachnospiraceae bacterium]
MSDYDKVCIDTFLKNQLQLFPEPVAENPEEAEEFLDEVCALVFKDKKGLIKMLKDEMDVSGMSDDEILSQDEVFALPDGRYLFVEG